MYPWDIHQTAWWQRFCHWRGVYQTLDSESVEVLRASLQVRCRQSLPGFIALTLTSFGIVAALYSYGIAVPALVWSLTVVVSIGTQVVTANRMIHTHGFASPDQLQRTDRTLRHHVMVNQGLTGAGVWYVIPPGQQEVAFFVTLLLFLFAIGSMINLSSDFRSFSVALPILLLQPILYWTMQGPLGNSIAITMLTLTVLMLLSARKNSLVFRESVLMRFEKEQLLKALIDEKEQVKHALGLANQANNAKAFFLAAASHDLRQPLYAATLLADALMMQSDARIMTIVDRQKHALDILRSQLDNLLDLSRFESGQIQAVKVRCALDKVFDQVAMEFSPVAEHKGIQLTIERSGLEVWTDPQLLHRLLSNLISNAIKYSERGSVDVMVLRHGNAHCRVLVKDHGCGIPENRWNEIFNAYVQLDNSARNREKGVGLGLAIAKHIDDLLQLDFGIESSSPGGTVFAFELPVEVNNGVSVAEINRIEEAQVFLQCPLKN